MTDENTFKRVDWTGDSWQPSDDDENGMPVRSHGPGLSAADLELLTQAARAIGTIRVEVVDGEEWVNLHFSDGTIVYGWNPLRHSDDTLDLAVRLAGREGGVAIMLNSRLDSTGFATVYTDAKHVSAQEYMLDDPMAATRLAVTRAAGEIGKSMG